MTDRMPKAWTYNDLTEQIIGAAIEVHRQLVPGLLEKVYEECRCRELELRGIPFKRQVAVPIIYKGEQLKTPYRCDLWVADMVIVENKAVAAFTPIDMAQLLGYLKLLDQRLGPAHQLQCEIPQGGGQARGQRYGGLKRRNRMG